MFLGPKITTVFASRWKALAWSGGVLMTAYCSVPSDDGDDPPGAATRTAATGSEATVVGHVSPWAISTPTPPGPDH